MCARQKLENNELKLKVKFSIFNILSLQIEGLEENNLRLREENIKIPKLNAEIDRLNAIIKEIRR